MAQQAGPEAPLLSNSVFTDNTAGNHGAGLHCERGDIVVRDCPFTGNTAGSGAGAGDEVTGGVVFEPWNATADCEEEPPAVPGTWTSIKAAHRGGP